MGSAPPKHEESLAEKYLLYLSKWIFKFGLIMSVNRAMDIAPLENATDVQLRFSERSMRLNIDWLEEAKNVLQTHYDNLYKSYSDPSHPVIPGLETLASFHTAQTEFEVQKAEERVRRINQELQRREVVAGNKKQPTPHPEDPKDLKQDPNGPSPGYSNKNQATGQPTQRKRPGPGEEGRK